MCIFDKERNEMWRASYINGGCWKTALHRRKGAKKFDFSSLRKDKNLYIISLYCDIFAGHAKEQIENKP